MKRDPFADPQFGDIFWAESKDEVYEGPVMFITYENLEGDERGGDWYGMDLRDRAWGDPGEVTTFVDLSRRQDGKPMWAYAGSAVEGNL